MQGPSFDISNTFPCFLMAILPNGSPGLRNGEPWTRSHHLRRKRVQPSEQSTRLPLLKHRCGGDLNETCHSLEILAGKGMSHSLGYEPVLFEPGTRAAVKLRNNSSMFVHQTLAQNFSKEMMIAVPLSLLIECNGK